MTLWLSAGMMLIFASVLYILLRWGSLRCVGVTPVHTFVFIAILFTSGLDVGLIMFPLTEFAGYADTASSPEYAFTNPLAIEFGFWGFLIWAFYFVTCFYFCVIEPKVKFFEIPWVKWINNTVIVGTCAFTAFLLLSNMPWYMPQLGDGEAIIPTFYLIVFLTICFSVYSSSDLKYVRILSVSTTWLFIGLIALLWLNAFVFNHHPVTGYFASLSHIGGYFANLHQFVLPLNDYHAFYLFWWFAWSIMIGQFTARFVGGLQTWQVLAAMLIFPSIPIALWLAMLYYYHDTGIATDGLLNLSMFVVGITFVINSLDSLVRLYSDNLQLTVARLGKTRYMAFNIVALSLLTLLFSLDFLQIQWIGAIVIGLFFACIFYVGKYHRPALSAVEQENASLAVNFEKTEDVH